MFRYVGQPKTCRLCHPASHFANACHTIICFNCEKTGYLASDCPAPIACNICKATNHLARQCPFTWTTVTEILPENEPDNTPPVCSTNPPMDNNDQSSAISRLAQRLLTSSTKWKAMLLLLLKNSLPPLKMMMIITRIPPNFLTRARKIFHQPLRLTLHYRMDEKPLSTSIVQHQQGSPDSPHSLLAKAANFPMNLTKTLL